MSLCVTPTVVEMGPHIISIGIAILLTVALATSEGLALFCRDDRINSLVQYVRVHGVARGTTALVAAAAVYVFAVTAMTARSEVSIPATIGKKPASSPCRIDDLANRSFVGAWRGRTAILHIIEPRVIGDFVVFEYDLTRAGEPARGKGSIGRGTCEVKLSSFDSPGRLVRQDGRLLLQSVEPAWELTAASAREAP